MDVWEANCKDRRRMKSVQDGAKLRAVLLEVLYLRDFITLLMEYTEHNILYF
jgi:hypothetical protein